MEAVEVGDGIKEDVGANLRKGSVVLVDFLVGRCVGVSSEGGQATHTEQVSSFSSTELMFAGIRLGFSGPEWKEA